MGSRASDISGQTFGRWFVLYRTGMNKSRSALYMCFCECGTVREVNGKLLRNGESKSCGCYKAQKASEMHLVDLTGQVFSRWTVIKRGETRDEDTYWLCTCECGTISEVSAGSLRSERSKSCGCYYKEFQSELQTTHGMSKHPVYSVWTGMKQRCFNPNDTKYHLYGGRGITVYDRWKDSFESFYADMGPRPDGYSIERRDGNGNYEPGNCHWATIFEQNNNTSRNKRKEA